MKGFWRGAAWFVAIVGAVVLLLYLFVFDTLVVSGDDPMLTVSMEPTLHPGDRILTRRGSSPQVGQLARCRSPQDPNKIVIGRVFGTGGDTVELKNELVTVDGKTIVPRVGCPPVSMAHPVTGEVVQLRCAIEENPAWSYPTLRSDGVLEGETAAHVDPGRAFLVSDNRHLHRDSRDYGQVDIATCEHVVYRLWGESYLDASRRNTILW